MAQAGSLFIEAGPRERQIGARNGNVFRPWRGIDQAHRGLPRSVPSGRHGERGARLIHRLAGSDPAFNQRLAALELALSESQIGGRLVELRLYFATLFGPRAAEQPVELCFPKAHRRLGCVGSRVLIGIIEFCQKLAAMDPIAFMDVNRFEHPDFTDGELDCLGDGFHLAGRGDLARLNRGEAAV